MAHSHGPNRYSRIYGPNQHHHNPPPFSKCFGVVMTVIGVILVIFILRAMSHSGGGPVPFIHGF